MSDSRIITLTLALNGTYLIALFGFMTVQVMSGFSPIPDGYGPLAMASATIVPTACIGLGNFLRQRRNCG